MKGNLFVLGGVVGGVAGMVMSAVWFIAGVAFTAAVLKDSKREKEERTC